jgi:hypothetical protein
VFQFWWVCGNREIQGLGKSKDASHMVGNINCNIRIRSKYQTQICERCKQVMFLTSGVVIHNESLM